jgi:hypothetical protein
MKNLSKTLLKGLFVITLFTGINVGLSTSGVKTINEAHAAVSKQQVYNYLVNLGYSVSSINTIQGTQNFICQTQLQGINYWTTVYTDGTNIIGIHDVPM